MILRNLVRAELIGRDVEIVNSKNKSLDNIKGKIIDETRNMITIQTSKGIKKVIKDQVNFRMKIGNKIVEVEGKKLVNRPEDRLKKIRK